MVDGFAVEAVGQPSNVGKAAPISGRMPLAVVFSCKLLACERFVAPFALVFRDRLLDGRHSRNNDSTRDGFDHELFAGSKLEGSSTSL